MALVTPTRDHVLRLSLIRLLQQRAAAQAKEAQPLAAIAILTLQDAAELFLALASEALGEKLTSKSTFIQYFEILEKRTSPVTFQQKPTLIRLNAARVNFKHHGVLPDVTAIEGFVSSTHDFLVVGCDLVWGLVFADVSLIDVVADNEVRAQLNRCRDLLKQGRTCAAEVSIAFAILLDHYGAGRGPHDHRHNPPAPPIPEDCSKLMKDHLEWVGRSLASLNYSNRIMLSGLDHAMYSLFEMWTYPAGKGPDGTYGVQVFPVGPTLESCRFCVDFVVDSALKLQAKAAARVLPPR